MTSRWQRCPWTRLPPAQLALPGTALYHLGAKMLENLPCLSFRASLLISTCPEMSRNSQARRLKRPELYTHGFQELLNAWIVETPIGQRWGQLAFYTGPSRASPPSGVEAVPTRAASNDAQVLRGDCGRARRPPFAHSGLPRLPRHPSNILWFCDLLSSDHVPALSQVWLWSCSQDPEHLLGRSLSHGKGQVQSPQCVAGVLSRLSLVGPRLHLPWGLLVLMWE